MWKAAVGNQMNINDTEDGNDDWDTDPDFINDVTEQEQRWGSRTVEGSGRNAGAIDMAKLRKETEEADAVRKKKEMDEGPKAAFGYGGKYGVQADRMDKSAVGHDYVAKVEKHVSQKDYSSGFGGKYGVQTDRIDKSAVTWDHKEKIEKHSSQKDYSTGFGGKFGVQFDRQDQSAVGWDHVEKMNVHESQKDYSKGFGGKYGVQSDRQDKCAVGWDHHEAPQKHESQTDHKIGFGGKFGVQTDRMDKSAASFNEEPEKVSSVYTKAKPDIGSAKPSALRAKFERMSEETQSQVQESPKTTPKHFSQAKMAFLNQPKQEEKRPSSEVTPKQLDQSKTDMFTKKQSQTEITEVLQPKQLDQSKIAAFTEQKHEIETILYENIPRHLDQSKIAMFTNAQKTESVSSSDKKWKDELEELRQQKLLDSTAVTTTKSEEPEPKTEEIKEPKQLQKSVESVYSNVEETNILASRITESMNINTVETIVQEASTLSEEVADTSEKFVDSEETEITLEDTGVIAVALFDYQAAADDEISFDPDDIITHVEMIDEGWWRGLCKNHYGLFPANYVQLQE